MKYRSIAIDGPSGAGKSTLAKLAAEHYGFVYLDTGAMYRCVGLYAIRKNVPSKDEGAVSALLPEINIEIERTQDGAQRMILNGEDVSSAIRSPEASIYASDVSAMPSVRAFLLGMQQDFAKNHNVIMDGRDIGTVVLPDADVKIFLTAKPEVRAKRRYDELIARGENVTEDEVLRDILYRDRNDSTRAFAPLRRAEDASEADTTELDLNESFALIREIIDDGLKEKN